MIVARSDYLDKNKTFRKFLDSVSDFTGKKFQKAWRENMKENLELFKRSGWATSSLQEAEVGKTAILMGASPAISKQVELLREIQYDPDFVMCGLSSNLRWLLDNGIQPKYCITVDADKSQGECFDNLDMTKTKNITLLASTVAYPPMLKKWEGTVKFLALGEADKKAIRFHRNHYGLINGNGEIFPSLMGQFNIMFAFILLVLGCHIVLFVGNELAYQTKESRYYVEKSDPRDKDKKYPHGDIYGNIVYTTPSLMALKLSLEGFIEIISGAGWFINCTEAGIFGITKKFNDLHVPWIKQLTLKNGIAQARHIMRTGEPFYSYSPGSIVNTPHLEKNEDAWSPCMIGANQ